MLAVFLGTYTAAFLCRAVAWRLLLPRRRAVLGASGILQVSLGANHLSRPGWASWARGAAGTHGWPVPVTAGSTVVARLLDVASLCLIALVLGRLAGGAAGERAPFEALTAPLALVGLAGGAGLLGARRFERTRAGPAGRAGESPPRPRRAPRRPRGPGRRRQCGGDPALAGFTTTAALNRRQLAARSRRPVERRPCRWRLPGPRPRRPPRPSPSPSRASGSTPAASASTRPA